MPKVFRGSLKSWVQARQKANKIEKELEEIYAKSASDSRKVVSVSHSIPNQHEKHEPVTECKAVQTNLSFPIETESSTSDIVAYVHVCWSSGDRSRRLPPDHTQLAIYLLRTQNKNMAKFALKHALIRAHILTFIEKEINKECQEMCRETVKVQANGNDIPVETEPKSRRDMFASPLSTSGKRKMSDDDNKVTGTKIFVKKDIRSMFKRTSKEDVMSFTFEKANGEMKDRCPLFWTILRAASTPHNSQPRSEDSDIYWQTSVVTAASICLKNRSQGMTVVQLLISLIINHSS